MDEKFKADAMERIARLEDHWRLVEFWVKRAEQVSKEARIPAINELRYASRQVINALRLLRKDRLTVIDKKHINKRISVAEQYLYNAEHDVCDAVIVFYDRNISRIDELYGVGAIATQFPSYPSLREKIAECKNLIAGTRLEYEDRFKIYARLREEFLEDIINCYQSLVDAEVVARKRDSDREYELARARATIGKMERFNYFAGTVTFVGVILSVFLWTYSKQEVCASYPKIPFVCGVNGSVSAATANPPSTGAKPDAPSPPQ